MGKKNKECSGDTPRSPWDIPTQALRDLMALHRNATAAASGSTYTPGDPFANPNRVGLLTLARAILVTAR